VVISLYNSNNVDELSIGNSISCRMNKVMDEELYNTFTSEMLTNRSNRRCLLTIGLIDFSNGRGYKYKEIVLQRGSHVPPQLLPTNDAHDDVPSQDGKPYSTRQFDRLVSDSSIRDASDVLVAAIEQVPVNKSRRKEFTKQALQHIFTSICHKFQFGVSPVVAEDTDMLDSKLVNAAKLFLEVLQPGYERGTRCAAVQHAHNILLCALCCAPDEELELPTSSIADRLGVNRQAVEVAKSKIAQVKTILVRPIMY
jgi:hypothetical protein